MALLEQTGVVLGILRYTYCLCCPRLASHSVFRPLGRPARRTTGAVHYLGHAVKDGIPVFRLGFQLAFNDRRLWLIANLPHQLRAEASAAVGNGGRHNR